jgi:outer membrane receptor protein involved in Fe transport
MTMKRLTVRSRAFIGTTAICLATVLRLQAQTTAAPAAGAAAPETEEETLVLSPFVVEAEEDTGYAARDTLAGTRVRTELKDVGSAIQVVTQKFLQDTNSKNSTDLLVYTTGTEVAGQGGNFTGGGDGAVIDTTSYTQPNPNTRVRGLAAADNLRDFFLTDIPWDSYNVGRVDLQRGANSVLFGIGSPAGIINSSINGATFKNENEVEFQFGSFGTHRQTADFNRVLVKDTLAVRVALLNDSTNYKQKPAFRDDERIFAAVRWDPKVFSDSSRTSIRANYETGEVNANYPRLTPPMDSITPWFGSMNKGTFAYQDSNNLTTFGNAVYNPWLGAAGNRIWDGLVSTFESNADAQHIIFGANVQNFPAADSSRNNTVNGSYKGIQAYNSYASNSRQPGYVIQPFKAKSLTDASIFDFYNNLIEGNNKRNWNEFDAFNISLAQTFLDDRLGFELAFDNQDSSWSYRNAISGDAAAITVDVMSTLADGSANPNVGRAMLIAGGGSAGSGWTNRTRETFRATAFGKFDFADVMNPDAMLTKILGDHNFTLAYTDYTAETFSKNWVNWYVGAGYGPVANIAVGQAGRDLTPVIYLSGDLRGVSSASGLGLNRVTGNIVAQSGTARQYDTTTMSFINYNVPVVTPNQDNGPYTNMTRAVAEIESQVAVWQAHLFGGTIVPMIGYRKDEAVARNAGTPSKTLGLVANAADPNWQIPGSDDDENSAYGSSWDLVEGETKTYSVVLHVPKKITDRLPGGLGLSFFYNRSENFEPDASRKDILGAPIAAPSGKTKDYGVTLSMLDSRLILKVNRYETSVTNATLNSGGLGNAYLIGAGEAWGQAAAYQLSINSGNWPGDGNYGVTSAASAFGAGNILRWQPAGNGPYTQAEIDAQYDIQRRSTNDWMAKPVPAAFQQAWGMTGYATGSGSWSMNTVHVTGDTLSKGTEFELIASNVLVKGLDVSLNAAKTDARRLSIAQAYSDWIEQRWEDYQGPMGDMRLWGNGNWALQVGAGGTVRDKFNNEVIPNYKLALALNGSNVPELRPWRFNATANYTFQEGRFKGANVGLSYRWQDKQITGYRLNSTLDGYDISNPYLGPTEDSVDFWVGYERKITERIKWRAQLNIRDAFASKTLIPVTVQPDGSPGAYRIPEPTVWTLTNTFSF